ncbi:MAG: cell division protein ZapA [Spirochaetota bacterium]
MSGSEEHIYFEILGEKFTLKSDVSKEYFLNLVDYLNEKIEEIKQGIPNQSKLRNTILAAINLADEVHRLKEKSIDEGTAQLISHLSESLASVIEENTHDPDMDEEYSRESYQDMYHEPVVKDPYEDKSNE